MTSVIGGEKKGYKDSEICTYDFYDVLDQIVEEKNTTAVKVDGGDGIIRVELAKIAEDAKPNTDIHIAFLVALIGAFCGSVFAYIFTRIHWKLTKDNEHLQSIKKSMILSIKKFESDAWEYWGDDSLSAIDSLKLQSRLEVKMKPLFRYSQVLQEKISVKSTAESKGWVLPLIKTRKEGFNTLDQLFEIYDLATGGEEYGKDERAVDVWRATLISQKCHSLISKLECTNC
ncbi:hypothetical protein F1529_10920 [Alcanivorax sp. VBW004]|uniref:hypothetical protein n=1 Tax=Alcanivorax sp. VBW004 TaxID=1287708 RepID=UPI0012BD487C|nr:hypothetical protein [Alcanivorax sp. VBW004]MTT52993.1 hypothetical protein [Alcanivorax sp. VBW004]